MTPLRVKFFDRPQVTKPDAYARLTRGESSAWSIVIAPDLYKSLLEAGLLGSHQLSEVVR